MTDQRKQFGRVAEVSSKLARVFQTRADQAREHFAQRIQTALGEQALELLTKPTAAWDIWSNGYNYAVDAAQRSILFWDTMRQRGNQYLVHEGAGKPPVLHFDYETVLDARKFERPVNYALLRIVPGKGLTLDPKRRPYIIIDPRAGHGPGIGGFKDDSQIGVALREGHPVYFVTFFPDPEPGQTLVDVTAAEQQFVHKVRELHPDSPKPVLVGNCQGGWAAMMLAVSEPDDTGPIVINGAPMSYWGGAWKEGEGDNPMRYSAGLLGGTWLASLTADLGNGVFDGAWLVQNFESLNPANALWDKYYNLYANADTEPPRFLEFERWWGGFFLMNRSEIEWITRNLFVGNKLWSGEVQDKGGNAFDLRNIQSPIVIFASMGDNITPPQQAFNWIADVYGSTDEIKARGQVIVGLLHKEIGHLGIFVSGKVAKKEHTQLVSVLKSIEALPPGLYGMQIEERKSAKGKIEYEVQFVERSLEEIQKRLNRFKRVDEKPFESVAKISDFIQQTYELFTQPLIQAIANDPAAKVMRTLHPLRVQHWAVSDLNPWLAWLGPAADLIKKNRRVLSADVAPRRLERAVSELVSASLDYYREIRDALSELLFFHIYGNMFLFYRSDQADGTEREREREAHKSHENFKQEALDAIAEGGYPEAVARVFSLLANRGMPFPLAQVHLKRELAQKYAELLPKTTIEQQRRIRGAQDIIVRYDRAGALKTLPKLVSELTDLKRLRALLQRVTEDEGVRQLKIVPEQLKTLKQIRQILSDQQARQPAQPKLSKPRLAKSRINLKRSRFKMQHAA